MTQSYMLLLHFNEDLDKDIFVHFRKLGKGSERLFSPLAAWHATVLSVITILPLQYHA